MTKKRKKSFVGWTNPIWENTFGFSRKLKATIPTIHRLRPNNNLYLPKKVRVTIKEV